MKTHLKYFFFFFEKFKAAIKAMKNSFKHFHFYNISKRGKNVQKKTEQDGKNKFNFLSFVVFIGWDKELYNTEMKFQH